MLPLSINLGRYKVAAVINKQTMSYDTMEYSSEAITMKKNSTSNGKPIWWEEVNLSRMKGTYLLITVNKLEFDCDKNIVSVDFSSRTDKHN